MFVQESTHEADPAPERDVVGKKEILPRTSVSSTSRRALSEDEDSAFCKTEESTEDYSTGELIVAQKKRLRSCHKVS